MWSRGPWVYCGKGCMPCKRRRDTRHYCKVRAQTQCPCKVLSTHMPLPSAFCLESCMCVCFYTVSPEERQSERWLLCQTDCRLNLAHLCLPAELGPGVMHLLREWWHQLLFFLNSLRVIEMEVGPLCSLDIQGMKLVREGLVGT